MYRAAKVLMALLIAMTAGAIALMAMGNNSPSDGRFCLADYYHLEPVENAILSRVHQSPARWNQIEIYYSATTAGNIEQLASLCGIPEPEDIDCHFVLCNGLGGSDGQIQPTENWQKQWSITPERAGYQSRHTIRICIVADQKTSRPTDLQIKRAEKLAQTLSRKFNIQPQYIHYPNNWL